MNNLMISKNLYIGILILITCLLSSCKDENQYDFVGDTAATVFFNSYQQTVTVNSFNFKVLHTPIGHLATIAATLPVRSTKEVTADVKVTCQIDNTLVDAYNKANRTTYKSLATGIVDVVSNTLTIAKGANVSTDSLKLSVTNDKLSQLTDPGYVVPVKISAVNSSDVKISSNLSIVYLVINTFSTNCYDNTLITDMVGTLVATRTAWTGTLNITPTSGLLSTMFDAKTNTYWYISPSQACDMTVNLGASFPLISGIRLHTSSTSYGITKADIYSSADGVNWVLQGGNVVISTASSYQYVKFYAPISAKYLKLSITGWRSATYIRMAEFDVYTN